MQKKQVSGQLQGQQTIILDTVRAIASAIAEHCKKFNDYFITELNLTPIEVDEMWSYVKKKKKIA